MAFIVDETTIILCGGPINYSDLPVGTNLSNAMIPVNGKPVIGWILDDLLAKGIQEVTVVLRDQDLRLRAFLQRAYLRRMKIKMVTLKEEGSIVQSLQAGLQDTPAGVPVQIILGDTLIRDIFESDNDFVYVGQVDDSRRWCLVILSPKGQIIEFIDKREGVNEGYTAIAGFYRLQHDIALKACVEESIQCGERQISDVLRRYSQAYPIYAYPVVDWYDFGNIDHLVAARHNLVASRYFNSLTINPILNTITKISTRTQKLTDELDWYLSLPDELKVLAPRILSHKLVDGKLEIVQEYYGYPTLAELYVYADLHVDTWLSILRKVLRIHREFYNYPGSLPIKEIEAFYLAKTWERLDELQILDPEWVELLRRPSVFYNEKPLRGIWELYEAISKRSHEISKKAPVYILHGDFCFSNILFDINSQIIRLIDPRGSFGRKGIYGDIRYDLAKLRHSVHECYDYIIADMFDICETKLGFEGQIYTNGIQQRVGDAFDQMIMEQGFDLDEIRFIEGLLFVSMLPIHHGEPRRQLMMYLTGLTLLNEVL
jgi:dTDP-glucose pyrophosphorylase